MGDPFIGEIRIFAFGYAPRTWADCDGQLLAINQNQALFSLLGTQYGGNGQTNFALPDLRGRVPVHAGSAHPQSGLAFGEEFHTLTIGEMPTHTHVMQATNNNTTTNQPGTAVGYARSGTSAYGPSQKTITMAAGSVGTTGGSQPHENRQPFLVLRFCIALIGVFPSRN